MKNKKVITLLSIVFVMVFFFATCLVNAQTDQLEKIVIKIAHGEPEGRALNNSFIEFNLFLLIHCKCVLLQQLY